MFLKLYASEASHCAIPGGVDEKTFHKWSWLFGSWLAVLATQVESASAISYDSHSPSHYLFFVSLDTMGESVLQYCWEHVSGDCRWYRLLYQQSQTILAWMKVIQIEWTRCLL